MTLAHRLVVLARAGGGHSFSGGGGGGGGHSYGGSSYGGGSFGGGYYGGGYYGGGSGAYGGSGSGTLIVLLLVGGIGVFLVALLVLSFWRSSRAAAYGDGGTRGFAPGAGSYAGVAPGGPSQYDDTHPIGVPQGFQGAALPGTNDSVTAPTDGAAGVAEGLAQIRAHDPAFDDQSFISRAERVFFIVQQAWMECKPEMSRQVMADGLWQQHRAQIGGYVTRNQRNALDQLAVARCDILSAHSDATYDSIVLRILAASADYDVDARTGSMVRGNREVRQWREDWLFQRASRAVTKPDGGIGAQRCPNCGAPLDVDLAGVCSFCKAPVMSGDYDWVLTRIDQVDV